MSFVSSGIAMSSMAMMAAAALAQAKAEHDHVQSLPPDAQAGYWAEKERLAAIERKERQARAMEDIAREVRNRHAGGGSGYTNGGAGFIFGLALGGLL